MTLRDRVSADAPRLIQAGAVLAQIDVLAGLAELAASHGYCRPEIVDRAGPRAIESTAATRSSTPCMPPGEFVPNDACSAPTPA